MPSLTLRNLPADLHLCLKQQAAAHRRSLSARRAAGRPGCAHGDWSMQRPAVAQACPLRPLPWQPAQARRHAPVQQLFPQLHLVAHRVVAPDLLRHRRR